MMTRPVPDHYAVLHVSADATSREIARAYRALMRRHHPDVAGGESAPAELQLIMQAFSVLRDPQRRRAYDREAARTRKSVPPARATGPQEHPEADAQGARPRAERRNGRPQVIPVRMVRRREPPFRATPVRWESGPWA
ncbi:J domain-containing protein [Arthrobacter sp. K5]|uniref:J domain-containing protein n=1 Tax=Arthrobacter sp. K5 TaxID=2839623 RepID=A0AAU8EM62_9MICC